MCSLAAQNVKILTHHDRLGPEPSCPDTPAQRANRAHVHRTRRQDPQDRYCGPHQGDQDWPPQQGQDQGCRQRPGRAGTRVEHRRRNRCPHRSQLHDLAGARAGGDPCLQRFAPQPDHCPDQPEDRHSARGRATLPAYLEAAGLCRFGRQQFLAAAQDPHPGLLLSVIHPADRFCTALSEQHQSHPGRVLLAGGAGRSRSALRGALGHLACDVGSAQYRQPPAGLLHLTGPRHAGPSAGRPVESLFRQGQAARPDRQDGGVAETPARHPGRRARERLCGHR